MLAQQSTDLTPIIVAVIMSGAVILASVIGAAVKILGMIRRVDSAVNGHDADEPRLYDRVVEIDHRIDRLCIRTVGVEKSNNRIAAHLGLEPIELED